MTRVLRALALLIGLVLLGGGIAAAAYVGPDDDIWLQQMAPQARAGDPIITGSELTAYTNATLLVRAEADGGVFIGSGHAVDVSDLQSYLSHHEVTGIRRTELLGADRQADDDASTARKLLPGLDIWEQQSRGNGPQELRLDLDGTPQQVVVLAEDEVVPSLTFGAHVGGLFAIFLAIAGLGLAIVALSLWRMGRARRRRRAASAPAMPPHGTQYPVSQPAGSFGRPQRVVASLVPLALMTTACGMVPAQAESETPSKVSVAPEQLDALLASYDKRNNAAIKASKAPRYDASKWQDADAGPVLDGDVASTRYAEASNDRGAAYKLTHAGLRVYAPEFTSYPMWALAVSDVHNDGLPKKQQERAAKQLTQDDRSVSVALFWRESALEPWRMRVSSAAALDTLPEPSDEASAKVGKKVLAQANSTTKTLLAHLAGGPLKGGLRIDEGAKEIRKALVEKPSDISSGSDIEFDDAVEEEDEKPRAVAVDGGHLVLEVRSGRKWVRARPGLRLQWTGAAGSIRGSSSTDLFEDMHLGILVFVPSDGSKPRVLSTSRVTDPI